MRRVRGQAVAVTRITNTGHRAGVAVPQLYLHKPARKHLRQPVRQLVGYAAVPVPAGRTALVRIPLVDRSFATWTHGGWRILSGCYRLDLGRSSRQLVDTARVARGAACPRATLRLGTTGRFFRPLALPARSRMLPRR